jgi:hypothetical protein
MIQTLIEDYKRRLKNSESLMVNFTDPIDLERIRTKRSEWHTFVSELEKIQAQLEKNIDRLLDN